jgi:hypothetical protein
MTFAIYILNIINIHLKSDYPCMYVCRYGGMVFGETVPSIPAKFSNFTCVNINCDTVKRLGVRNAVKVWARFYFYTGMDPA